MRRNRKASTDDSLCGGPCFWPLIFTIPLTVFLLSSPPTTKPLLGLPWAFWWGTEDWEPMGDDKKEKFSLWAEKEFSKTIEAWHYSAGQPGVPLPASILDAPDVLDHSWRSRGCQSVHCQMTSWEELTMSRHERGKGKYSSGRFKGNQIYKCRIIKAVCVLVA